MKVLLLYTTREGQTRKIMQRIAEQLTTDIEYDLVHLKSETMINLSHYQGVLVGSSIRYGYYPQALKKFITENYYELNHMFTAFFGVNMVARKPNKNTPETNLYTRKFLEKSPWKPTMAAVFAGALYYPRYGTLDRNMIRLIMWMGKGETDVKKPIVEYTNWEKVTEFAQNFSQKLVLEMNKKTES
ncbi:menaquinone-dependent protoporphyrinogen IX dehydrogenase [Zophobihabitans entericus]|uniref:Protoporphyrinogen IX dehydrogenase [quinone] n=1 Tax=Zophobihabitans entericus TaxID=1635327 RepID=A0A6G9IAP4_9GAMM|nr:menaquinone-dependent protoporphyrinogen IX dehydrogenase [Zophobihabitans entericus]QIQ20794.1 menaquinone-dependent protoporphyrinogen IX dehydrogenase [Zophobihabitans entericus]